MIFGGGGGVVDDFKISNMELGCLVLRLKNGINISTELQ
jgi:hypothetical protein